MRNIMKEKIRALVTLQIKWVEDSAFFCIIKRLHSITFYDYLFFDVITLQIKLKKLHAFLLRM